MNKIGHFFARYGRFFFHCPGIGDTDYVSMKHFCFWCRLVEMEVNWPKLAVQMLWSWYW